VSQHLPYSFYIYHPELTPLPLPQFLYLPPLLGFMNMQKIMVSETC
jgi:hypothetical protein